MANLLDLASIPPVYGGLLPSMAGHGSPMLAPVTASTTPLLAPQPSFFDRVERRLLGAPAFGAPSPYPGLLDTQDEAEARRAGLLNIGLSLLANSAPSNGHNAPPTLAALAQAIQAGRQGFQQQMQGALQQKVTGAQIQQQAAQQAQMHALAAKYAPQPNETPEQTRERMTGLVGDLIRLNPASAGQLGSLASELFKPSASAKTPSLDHIDLGDRVGVLAPDGSGRLLAVYAKGKEPKTADQITADDRFTAQQTNTILDDFRTDTKDYQAARSGYEVLRGALAKPGIAQPFAVLDAYARVVNPGAVVRQGTMAVLQEMGSYDQKVRRWLAMAEQGKWPPDMLASIKNTVDAIMAEHTQSFEKARQRAILRGRRLKIDVAPLLPTADATGAVASSGKPYSPDNPFKP